MGFGALYTFCFVLGLTVVGASWLLGHHGAGHGHAAPGGHGSGHGEATLPLFSPTVLAVFLGMFGAGGLFGSDVLHLGSPWHLVTALGTSALSGLTVAFAMLKLLEHGETNSMSRFDEVVGRDVEVITAMRGSDVGEVAFESGGSRQTALARSASGEPLPVGARVRVRAQVDGVLEVRPAAVEEEPVPPVRSGTPVR